MNKPETAEIAWAALDAHAIAKVLDRLTADECGLPARELCLARAHAWALFEGLQAMLAGLPKVWVHERGLAAASAPDAERAEGRQAAC